jgi:hypothetical protein
MHPKEYKFQRRGASIAAGPAPPPLRSRPRAHHPFDRFDNHSLIAIFKATDVRNHFSCSAAFRQFLLELAGVRVADGRNDRARGKRQITTEN